MHYRRTLRLICLLLCCLVLPLAGCGQKGDLYHPEDQQAAADAVSDLIRS